jgi:mRNA-degrading endonuclease toxin of MazEF toxin-antitoxin module
MKAWEIYGADIFGEHPCVLVSAQKRIDRKLYVVVLKCTTLRPGAPFTPNELETVLDEADGLDWKTRVQCDLMFTVEKSKLTRRRGEVSFERRREIARKMIQGLAIAGL